MCLRPLITSTVAGRFVQTGVVRLELSPTRKLSMTNGQVNRNVVGSVRSIVKSGTGFGPGEHTPQESTRASLGLTSVRPRSSTGPNIWSSPGPVRFRSRDPGAD